MSYKLFNSLVCGPPCIVALFFQQVVRTIEDLHLFVSAAYGKPLAREIPLAHFHRCIILQTVPVTDSVLRHYRVAQKWHHFLYALTSSNIYITDFQNYFTLRIRRKFVIILSLKIPPHLNCVATLPFEMSNVLNATIENDFCNNTLHMLIN